MYMYAVEHVCCSKCMSYGDVKEQCLFQVVKRTIYSFANAGLSYLFLMLLSHAKVFFCLSTCFLFILLLFAIHFEASEFLFLCVFCVDGD